MPAESVSLSFKEGPCRPDSRCLLSVGDFTVERVRMHQQRAFEYDWRGTSHYLAIHDIDLLDGETLVDGARNSQGDTLRDRMTFAPSGCRVRGWSALAPGEHGYLALFFPPDIAEAERERPLLGLEPAPLIYFEDPSINWTLRRLQQFADCNDGYDVLAAETLCLAAALQLYPIMQFAVTAPTGRLTLNQQRRIDDYVAASLKQPISLTDLAMISGMSRFHFARSFRRTYGQPPHQYVLRRRIALAVTMLTRSNTPIAEIAQNVGFSAPARFSTAFRRTIGCSPRVFRERAGWRAIEAA